MQVAVLIIGLLSPTFWLATLLKQEVNKAKVIRLLNLVYFIIAMLSIFLLLAIDIFGGVSSFSLSYSSYLAAFWSVYLLSRCSEIYIAFLRDALDKVSGDNSEGRGQWWPRSIVKVKNNILSYQWISKRIEGKPLEHHDRLVLSFRSYFELIANFAILYFLAPPVYWKDCKNPEGIWESSYFSGVTITTLGYGDITPAHWFPQFLTVFEVICGFVLIVVCFAVYLQKDNSDCGVNPHKKNKK